MKILCALLHYIILHIYNIMNMFMYTLFTQKFSVLKNANLVTVLSRKEDRGESVLLFL
jgi:hypothetical protein